MPTYSFSDQAELDLIGIVDYTLKQWSQAQAERYIDALKQQCQMLADNPKIGSDLDSLTPSMMSFPYESHTLYLYTTIRWYYYCKSPASADGA